MSILTREAFRTAVLARDGNKCVFCSTSTEDEQLDAHHILDRKLWEDGGYYLDNGATVCSKHHMLCEQTVLSCDEVRKACGIRNVVLPPQLYEEDTYDKWGNIVLPNLTRVPGEMFTEASVQKVLAEGGVLELFTGHVKYPRTWHLPWSPGVTRDDRVQHDLSRLEGQEVVATVKMDGENTTLYADGLHARSLAYASRVDRDRMRALHASLSADIPDGWRVCGENAWAEHSIRYENLPDFFLVFSVWNEKNICLSWDETVEWAALLGLRTVPTIWRGTWNESFLRDLYTPTFEGEACEGYVVRLARSFAYGDFRRNILKYVRKGHVTTGVHWTQTIRPNGFAANR